ncbi:similar to Saccharomyces cerevisiae YGR150C CCM1 Mitochondrial 15s rRNA-binding protein [Maudiozyma saulgeensis]|uniref:Similar to Saccharomyces cerevisiae YGR150C CCM1 Mitochondrial 15s rRNA-binding protein n=1 Tax=Maudiozyma saulgeensis TaxID=1789683 RepID=A0A1X7R5V0_9SACH|nr:similar to Saccharomyces cerevisiae YGR150C CCM1 Mitochondrial 15s rRNA-binding protein [Kazachstania saulgeensis]
MHSTKNISRLTANSLRHLSKRGIVIPRSKNKKMKPIKSRTRHVTLENINPDDIMAIQDPKLLEFKVKQLREYTKRLKERLRTFDTNKIRDEEITDPYNAPKNDIADTLLNSFTSKSVRETNSINIPADPVHTSQTLSDLIDTVSTHQIEKLIPEDARKIVDNDTLVLKSLLNKKNINWNLIVTQLISDRDSFLTLSAETINNWLISGVTSLSFKNIKKLDERLQEWTKQRSIPMSPGMYDCLLRMYSKLTPQRTSAAENADENMVIQRIEDILKRMDDSAIIPNEFNLTACVTYCSKLKNFKTMNHFLEKFQTEYGLTPNKHTYTKIIQFYDELGLEDRAWNTFDTMKFLSKSHKPDIFTYNMMLHICDKQKNYSKAIDLFYEIEEEKLTPNHSTFVTIAKTLASSSGDNIVAEGNAASLRLLGWKFISKMFEYEDYDSVASMMALAAYDGDITLCRALFFKYTMSEFTSKSESDPNISNAWKKSIKPILFNYLLLSYSKFKPDYVPLLVGWPEGAQMRRTILNSVDYTGKASGTRNVLPLLPLRNLSSTDHILAESNALWKFVLANGDFTQHTSSLTQELDGEILQKLTEQPTTFEDFKFNVLHVIGKWKMKYMNNFLFNHRCLVSYLSIPLRLNSATEFWERLDTYTFKESEFDDKLLDIFYETKLLESETIQPENTTSKQIIRISSMEKHAEYLASIGHKILYDNSTFDISMKGATKFNNLERAKKEWIDRGKYRKTENYMKLDETKKSKLDSEFAKIMVNFFVSQRKYDEAMSIVLTSKRNIRWKYGMVKNLIKGLESIEDERNVKILLDILNRKPTEIAYINKQIDSLDLNMR